MIPPERYDFPPRPRVVTAPDPVPCPVDAVYCVYTHAYAGTVFYVGMGRPDRPYVTKGRSARWHDFVRQCGVYDVAIVYWAQSEAQARRQEARFIQRYAPICNQVRPDQRTPRYVPLVVPLPPALHVMLLDSAQQDQRSLTLQVCLLLCEALAARAEHSISRPLHRAPDAAV